MASRDVLPVDEARQRVDATIDEIQELLSPRRVIAESFDRAVARGSELASTAGDAARAHPLAIGAAAVAVGLALFAQRRLSKARVNLGDDHADYTDYDDGFGFPETESAPAPAAKPPRAGAAAPVAPKQLRASVAAPAPESTANPVVSIVIGLLAGAALGAAFPTSEAERRLLGDTGMRLGDAARSAARRAAADMGMADRGDTARGKG
jgi:hypothetical protein